MNLHEEVSRIKSMMGVLTEDEVTFPIIVSDSYNTAFIRKVLTPILQQ